jgi:glycosyltransferase involved in cell wall biosynthesis
MFSIAIIDILGLTYDGTTLSKRGLGGSESAVILMSRELSKLGFSVTVFNNCSDRQASEGIYDDVNYIDITRLYQDNNYKFDIVISSRTLLPFVNEMNWGNFNPNPKFFKQLKDNAKLKIVWMHDTFCGGDHLLEEHLVNGDIDEIFTLSDFHTSYVTSCAHGPKRNFEVLKDKVFITRNGIVNYFDEVDISKKDRNLFVYNASVTKGMLPLVRNIWERVKQKIPDAKLKVIGGYYRFRENAEPDEQEKTWRELIKDSKYSNLHIEFTGIITQKEIAEILSNASYMIYPGAFPETFGISSLESLCYNTPLITTRFGALEETAIEQASYFIDYAIEPNSLYPHINQQLQEDRFVNLVLSVYNNPYLHQQKMYYCNIIKDVCGWDTVALQWKQHLYKKFNSYLPIEEYRKVQDINYKIHKIFGRMHSNKEEWYEPKRSEQRISVVSTFYNAENFIEKCILSVASQNYDNYCHILVNDCSTDNSQFVAEKAIQSLPKNIQSKFILINRKENEGAVYNQVMTFRDPFIKDDDIVMILDGDDWLVNEPDVFDFYNNLYQNDETEFSYGSCWSVVDNIPLISQPYPKNILEKRAYRQHKFNWGLPYTHLRTFRKRLINNVNDSVFLDEKRNWFRAGGDVATFYNIIEQADPKKVKCVSRIVYNYNDANPLNDYKVNSSEQNRNADMIANKNHKFSIIVPTMWRCKELFKKCLDRIVEHPLIDEILIINNEVQSTPNWSVLANSKIKMKNQSENIKVNKAWNLGLKESRNDIICLMNDDILFDEKLFEKIKDRIVPESGVYGLITGEAKFKHPTLTDGSIDFVEWKPKDNIHGFGQLMFLHKSNWKPIIDGLEIYFGDDYIFHNQLVKNLKNYLITNICWESPMAATTSDEKIT